MSPRPILLWPDPVLKVAAAPVAQITAETERLANEMLAAMYDAQGRGLAAPQLGEMQRLFVMDATWKDGRSDPQVFVNPEIEEVSAHTVSSPEGCLSIPGILTEISRPAKVRVSWTGLSGGRFSQVFDGFAAVCVQHEIDHLNGIVTFDRLSEAARAKALKDYEALG